MDSSRELASIYAMNSVISLYLILLIGVQTFDMTGSKLSQEEPNRPLSCFSISLCCLSHPVLKRKPNASYMCIRIKFRIYDRLYKCISETISQRKRVS
jgi:hypothetical protein